jgi:hypothetical protein
MMKKLINTFTLKNTKKYAEEILSIFPPIVLTCLPSSLFLTLMLMAIPSFAEQAEDKADRTIIQSYSHGQLTKGGSNLPAALILNDISQRKLVHNSDQTQQNKQVHKEAPLRLSLSKSKAGKMSNHKMSRSFSDGNFFIYEAYSQLIEDYDVDGYYQTFSVTFDADLVTHNSHDEALVYAELYLSENGGPWQHYYTTNSFLIHGESSDDEYEVYSNLAQGFEANTYNVLIELYEVGYVNTIAAYSSDDSNSLYSLPLESGNYDINYNQYYEETHVHGGGLSLIALLIINIFVFMRLLHKSIKS